MKATRAFPYPWRTQTAVHGEPRRRKGNRGSVYTHGEPRRGKEIGFLQTKEKSALLRFKNGIRRRPTLPGRCQPSTISVLRLNFCVRYGNRWIPQAIVTGNFMCSFRTPSKPHRKNPDHTASTFPSVLSLPLRTAPSDQALDRLVSSSFICYHTSTDDLSTSSSLRGLTCSKQWQFYSPGGLHA